MAEEYRKSVLPNGIRVVTERMPHVRSVAVGIWVDTGSRNEPAERAGVSHLIEHLVFKGTQSRTAEEIARTMDSVGGQMDAFTAKEHTCFFVNVLDEHLPLAMDVISDLVLQPLFKDEDISKERGVVLEELKMDEDQPDHLVHEIFTQNFWKDHPLGKPILGTKETVKRLMRPAILDYYARCYEPRNMMVTAAGNLEHGRLVDLVAEAFGGLRPRDPEPIGPAPATNSTVILRNKKNLEQVHLCMGVPSYPLSHERRYACYVLNTLLGGGMSSRLFQNIREREGLAYAVFSELSPCSDTGCLSVYAGTSLESAPRVVEFILKEFRDLKKNMVPAEELRRAKDHLKGSLMLSLESTTSRMSNLARQEMYFGRFFTLDEIIERIEEITVEDVLAVANEFFHPQYIALTVLGHLNGLKFSRDRLAC